MTNPEIRGIAVPPFKYEPHSLGAVGPGGDITLCGRGKASNHQPGQDKVVSMPAPGSQFTFEAKITAHHKGHMIVRVCPFITGSTDYSDMSNCIRLSGEGGDVWPLSAGTGMKQWVATLPSKAELDALNSPKGVFTIQWRWNTANSCAASSALGNSNCGEQKCCSEVFTNCADVVFDGINSSPPDAPVDPPRPRPRPSRPRPGPRPTGGGSGKCVSAGPWAGQKSMDAWCARNKKCGDDGEQTCDCTCGGTDTKPEPEPEPEANPEPEPKPEVGHVVTAKAEAAAVLSGLSTFCQANKAYLCDPAGTDEYLGNLCDCSPASTEGSTPEPEAESEPEPEADAENEPDADSLSFTDCKKKCQTFCVERSGGVATNQGWGKPRYIHCKCSDGFEKKFTGCECRNGGCPDSMKVSLASTKFAGQIRQKVDAHGELSLD